MKKSAKKSATKKAATKKAVTKKAAKKPIKKATTKKNNVVKSKSNMSAKELINSIIDNNNTMAVLPKSLLLSVWRNQLKSMKLKEDTLTAKSLFDLIIHNELISPSTIERCRTSYLLNIGKKNKKFDKKILISNHPVFTSAA